MKNNDQKGMAVILLAFVLLVIILLSSALIMQYNKTRTVERINIEESNLKTYYVAMAGINECMATRMSPPSNVIKDKYSYDKYLEIKYKNTRIGNSGIVYANPYNKTSKDILGTYTFVSYPMVASDNNNESLNKYIQGSKYEKFVVYSKGKTKMPNGKEDTMILKAVYDINRSDDDVINADEVEDFQILPITSDEAKYSNSLINYYLNDRMPPGLKEVEFSSLGGDIITVKYDDFKNNKPINVGVRSKITLRFTESVDSNFLDGIKLKNVKLDKPIENLKPIAMSPKNMEVVLLPTKKKDGKSLDFATEYKLEVTDISDYSGNTSNTLYEVNFITENASKVDVNNSEDSGDNESDKSNNESAK